MVSTRASSRAGSLPPIDMLPPPTPAPGPSPRKRKPAPLPRFTHAPSSLTLFWMAVSLPLVAWDTCYVLGRPHTMEGGFAHWPLWSPYKLYGEIDYIYGWKAVHDRNGFTAAQATLNLVESALYLWYLGLWYLRRGKNGSPLAGRDAALAVMVGFSAAVMTLSKTVLYWCNEYFSGFSNIGHNNAIDILFLWIIPNGAWLIGPTYMIYALGSEMFRGLDDAAHSKRE